MATHRRQFVLVHFLVSAVLLVVCQWDFPNQRPQWDWDPDYHEPCPPDWDGSYPCIPPYMPFDEIRVQIPNIGIVVGHSMHYAPNRYINNFLGVPYAKPPIFERRFKPPEDPGPGWDKNIREWRATWYRPACPQEIWQLDHRYYDVRNVSEDCLFLNVFAPNLTDRPDKYNRDYPVMVFIDGDDYKLGDSMLWPGHYIAKEETMIVTLNYRLGALGFLSTLDDHARGNWGIYDILKVLEWIQKYIKQFRGDPKKVTIVGMGSGSGIAGLLLLSKKSYMDGYRPLFHKAILMSGSDLCDWSVIEEIDDVDHWYNKIYKSNALEYAKDLGREVGCDPDYGLTTERMVDCLRYKHFEEIVNASAAIPKKYGTQSGPFGPVVDGENGILPLRPKELREKEGFMKDTQIIAGLNRDEGAYMVDNITKEIIGLKMEEGMDPGTFRDLIYKMVREKTVVRNVDEVVSAIEFEYTFWAKPDNMTAVRQNLVDLYGDMYYGWCVDELVKAHSSPDGTRTPIFFYVFDHRSEYEILPEWMGVPHLKDTEYLFGYPFVNETLGNITGLVPQQWDWTYLDRNISVFVMEMWVNFTKFGNPTPLYYRNISWYPYNLYNLSVLHIQEFSFMDINYRQNHFAFWREYFPSVSKRWPITTTPGATPQPLVAYQAATWSMTVAACITIAVIAALGIALWRRRHHEA